MFTSPFGECIIFQHWRIYISPLDNLLHSLTVHWDAFNQSGNSLLSFEKVHQAESWGREKCFHRLNASVNVDHRLGKQMDSSLCHRQKCVCARPRNAKANLLSDLSMICPRTLRLLTLPHDTLYPHWWQKEGNQTSMNAPGILEASSDELVCLPPLNALWPRERPCLVGAAG